MRHNGSPQPRGAAAGGLETTQCSADGLSDLIAECVREDQSRRSFLFGSPGGDSQLGSSSPSRSPSRAGEALVTLVRREARAAANRELASLLKRLPPTVCIENQLLFAAESQRETPLESNVPYQEVANSQALHNNVGESDLGKCSTACAESGSDGNSRDRLLHGLEGRMNQQRRALASLKVALAQVADRCDGTWKGEAELRAEGDRDVESRLLLRAEALEKQISHLHSSVGALMKVQLELGSEAKMRQDADVRLQTFLKDFRAHIVGEVEDLWNGQRALGDSLDGIRGLITKVVALVELHSEQDGERRVTGPDELADVTFGLDTLAWSAGERMT